MTSLRLALVLLAAISLLVSGCVRRRLLVRSQPSGALVYVDNQEIGVTPAATPFTYYGTREIRLVRDGYETLTEKHTITPPPYQYPVVEFFAENLWPWEIRDERELHFEMTPQRIVPTEELLQRGESLRNNSRQGIMIPQQDAAVLAPPPTPTSVAPVPTPAVGGYSQAELRLN